jgi:serine/threonine-protein kinase HipA
VDDEDDFGLLLRYGADCIGAVGITADGEGAAGGGDSGFGKSNFDGSEEDAAVSARRTLSGVQKKLLAYSAADGFHPSVSLEDPATHIAKFNHPDEPTLVQNEALTLRLAREVLGSDEITRAAVGKVRGVEGVALLVERFDRCGEERLRLEDFAQILVKPRGRDFRGKYASSYEEAGSVVAAHSARASIDLLRYFRLVSFNLVVGNADAHLKNFSLLERKEGLRLSPAYDLLNTVVYPQFDAESALEIGGRLRPIADVDATLLRELGRDIGIQEKAVELALVSLRKGFERAPSLKLGPHVSPDDFRSRYVEVVDTNRRRILQ